MNEQDQEPLLFNEFPPISSDEWQEIIIKDLKGADYDKKLIWNTYDGLAIKPFYRQEDMPELKYLESVPGHSPFVRGNRSRSNAWVIRQDINFSDPVKANEYAKVSIQNGVEAIGLDAFKINTSDQLETMLSGIDLTKTQIHFTSADSFPALLELFIEYIDNHQVDRKKVKGSFNYDPVSCLVKHGKFHRPWETHTGRISVFIHKVSEIIPGFKAITINAQLFHDAGSSLVQELGYGLGLANEYLVAATDKGLNIDEITASILFTFAVGSDYFPEIAKLRAARYLWDLLVKQYQPVTESSRQMYIHSTTSAWNKTVYDPYVNLLRTTTETMSAAIAGSSVISVAPFDQTYKEADEFSLRLARNQQIILQYESYLDKIIDPGAGSYYIEKLTDEIARSSWEIFRKTEEKGGFISCFKQNIIQDEIEKVSTQKVKDISSRKMTLLGTNQYPNLNEEMLDKVVLPGKIRDAEQPATRPLQVSRGAETLEMMRLATEKHSKSTGKKPDVFLFSMGNLGMRKARATFSTNFFGSAGYNIIDNPGFASIEEGIESCLMVNPEITVICSSDEEYSSLVPAIVKGLRKKGYQGIFVLAGYPREILEEMKSAGIQHFIHVRTNLLESLQQFHQQLGITI